MNRRQFLFRSIGTGVAIALAPSIVVEAFTEPPTDTLTRLSMIYEEITARGDWVLSFQIGANAYDDMWEDIHGQMGIPPAMSRDQYVERNRFGEFELKPVRHDPRLEPDCIKVVAQKPNHEVYSELRGLA